MTPTARLIITASLFSLVATLGHPLSGRAGSENATQTARLTAAHGHTLVGQGDGTWYLLNAAGKRLLASSALEPATMTVAHSQVLDFFGTYRFFRAPASWTGPQGVPELLATPTMWVMRWPADDSGDRWTLRARARGNQGFELDWQAPRIARALRLQWRVDPSDRFLGFGSRTNACVQRGRTIDNWVQEGGNGKSDSPILGVSNYPTASHVPLPVLLSTAGFGLRATTDHRSVWEVGTRDAHTLGLVADDAHLGLQIYPHASPTGILGALTQDAGRPQMPPLWAFGPTEFGKGGTEAVRQKAAMLRRARIPASAIWYEDWVGLEHGPLPGLTHLPWGRWVADNTHYPEIARLNQDLEAQGFKSLGYFNPFVSRGDPYAKELIDARGTLHDSKGYASWFWGPFGLLSQIDVTHPQAREWALTRLKQFDALGFDGAMVDFGEWTPRDAHFEDGTTGETMHNRYPDEWARLHHDFWNKARPDGDFVMYTRAGYQQAARHTTYMWAADQNTNWEKDDGFPTALTAILSAGLSGIPLMTHDIAGFATLGNQGVTKELYARWLAFGAFSTFMRTHSGQKPSLNWHIDSDIETLALHRHYANAHMRLVPYRQAAVKQSCDTGMPVMRHLYLAFPDAKPSTGVEDAYMLGDALLVAPVFKAGVNERAVWLPPGDWFDYWTRQRVTGVRTLAVKAPLSRVPVFVRAGSVLPLLPTGIQSLLPLMGTRDKRPFDVPGALDLELYSGKPGSVTLADGTRIRHWPPVMTARPDPSTIALGTIDASPGQTTWHTWKRENSEWTIAVDNPAPTRMRLSVSGVLP